MKKPWFAMLFSCLLLFLTFLLVSVQAWPTTPPAITAITPNTGPADRQTTIVIDGQNFVSTSLAYLNDTPLMDVTYVDSVTLQARVPFGLTTGVYTLTVTNPQTGTLTNAFTVTEGTVGWASGGPYGGRTRRLAIHPTLTNTVYVVADLAGLFRTQDGGEQWEQVFHSPQQGRGLVEVWPVDPSVVFFGDGQGFYRSDQGGDPESWIPVALDDGGSSGSPEAFAIAPSDPYTIYCSIGNTLFHSSDGGATWQQHDTGLPGALSLLAIDPQDAATLYAALGVEGEIYQSSDAGQQWARLPITLPVSADGEPVIESLAADPYRDHTLWVGTNMNGLHRSSDGGQTFVEVTSLYTEAHHSWMPVIAFDPNRDRIYVGTIGPNDAVYYSDDGGDSWHGAGLNNQGGFDIAVAPGNGNVVYTTWAGVRKSTDGAQSWTWLSEGISAIQPWRIAVSPHDPQRLMAVADSDGAFGSYNSGNEWITYLSTESHQYQALAFDPFSPTVAYLGGTEPVYKTMDDGQTWLTMTPFPLDGQPGHDAVRPLWIAVHPLTPTVIYAGGTFFSKSDVPNLDGVLFRSDDRGDSWTRITAAEPISPVNRIVLAPGHPETMYLATGGPEAHGFSGDGVWRSRDGGLHWEHPGPELYGSRVIGLVVHPENPNVLLAGARTGNGGGMGLYRSVNGGDSWQMVSGLDDWPERTITDIAYDPGNPRIAYAGTYAGLRVSFDGGASWQVYPGPMGQLLITAIALTQEDGQTRFYVGTIGGVVAGPPSAYTIVPLESTTSLGAGVYMGYSHWVFVHLPLVLRVAP
jgi:photosystem II stability/assembly factor-like uncharacterized protein